MKFAKIALATAAMVMASAQPAMAGANAAQRLSVTNATAKSVRAATQTSAVSRQDGNVPVWAIVLGVAVLGAGIYFLVDGDGTPESP